MRGRSGGSGRQRRQHRGDALALGWRVGSGVVAGRGAERAAASTDAPARHLRAVAWPSMAARQHGSTAARRAVAALGDVIQRPPRGEQRPWSRTAWPGLHRPPPARPPIGLGCTSRPGLQLRQAPTRVCRVYTQARVPSCAARAASPILLTPCPALHAQAQHALALPRPSYQSSRTEMP